MTQNVIYLGECSMLAWEEQVLCCCWMKYFINDRSSWFLVLCYSNIALIIFACWIYKLLKDVLNSPCITVDLLIYLYNFINFLLQVFRCSTIRCIHMDSYYVFIENCPLYHYIMPVFITNIFFLIVKYVLSKTNVASPTLFWLLLPWYISSNPLLLTYRYHISGGDHIGSVLLVLVSLFTLSISIF